MTRVVEEFVVLDLDRTLLNTTEVALLVLAGLVSQGVSEKQIKQAIAYMETQSGKSFYLFDYIAQEFPDVNPSKLAAKLLFDEVLVRKVRTNLLCAGANELIEELNLQTIPHMILTYGEQDYQQFKVSLFRKLVNKSAEQLPALITQSENKTEWIVKNWFELSHDYAKILGTVAGEEIQARRVIIIDDKLQNIITSHEHVHGLLVDNYKGQNSDTLTTAYVADALRNRVRLSDLANRRQETKS
jgi:hypothetical protein